MTQNNNYNSVSCLYDLLDLQQSGTWSSDGTIVLQRPPASSKLDKIKFRSFSANIKNSLQGLQVPTITGRLTANVQLIGQTTVGMESGLYDDGIRDILLETEQPTLTITNQYGITNFTPNKSNMVNSNFILEELFDNEISSDITATVVDDGVSREIVVNKENDVTLTDIEGDIEAVRGFYVGTTKNSATTILETIWSSETKNTEVPIYAYWRYGNGLVASFSCDINHNVWLRNWGSGTNGEKFLQNLSGSNLPTKREDVPLLVETEAIGTNTYLYVDTPTLNPNAKLTLEITDPSGDVNERDLVYTTEDYETNFETKEVGTYRLKITYTLEASNASPITYSKEYIYNVSYTEEYNSFNYYEISNLNHMVNTGNPVYEDADSINLSIDETKVTTYTYDFTVLFMTIAICLFVVDIFIRKVKWADIKQIFSHKH